MQSSPLRGCNHPRPSHTLPPMVSRGPTQATSLTYAAQLTSPCPDPATLCRPCFQRDPFKQPLSSTAAQLTSLPQTQPRSAAHGFKGTHLSTFSH